MKPPSMPSIDNYIKSIVPRGPPVQQVNKFQEEQNKLRMLMQEKAKKEHEMRMLELQIAKVQGALELLQQMMPVEKPM